MGKIDSDLGKFMIAAATIHDILLWLLVTVLFGLVDSPENWAGKYQPLASLLLVLVFILLLVKVFLPNATKVVATPAWLRMAPVNRLLVTITCMSVSGLITDTLQVHTLVGIVAFGACTPEAERPFILSHVEVMNRALLLPLFFGSAGLKVYLNRASPAVGGIFLGLTGSAAATRAVLSLALIVRVAGEAAAHTSPSPSPLSCWSHRSNLWLHHPSVRSPFLPPVPSRIRHTLSATTFTGAT